MKLSIICPSMHTPNSARTVKQFVTCLLDNTVSEFELLLSSHEAEDAYQCMNRLAQMAQGEYLVILNDDIYMAPGWDQALLAAVDPDTLVMGALVESGIQPVNDACILHNFGTTPETFDHAGFEAFVQTAEPPAVMHWGLPWCIQRTAWIAAGGYDTRLIGTSSGEILDHLFWRAWLDSGKRTIRVRAWGYHLMRWTSRDYRFGKRIEVQA